MAYVERTDEEIISALESAISKKAVDPNQIVLRRGDSKYTYNEILDECRRKTEFGIKFLNNIRECAKEGGRDPLNWLDHYSR